MPQNPHADTTVQLVCCTRSKSASLSKGGRNPQAHSPFSSSSLPPEPTLESSSSWVKGWKDDKLKQAKIHLRVRSIQHIASHRCLGEVAIAQPPGQPWDPRPQSWWCCLWQILQHEMFLRPNLFPIPSAAPNQTAYEVKRWTASFLFLSHFSDPVNQAVLPTTAVAMEGQEYLGSVLLRTQRYLANSEENNSLGHASLCISPPSTQLKKK